MAQTAVTLNDPILTLIQSTVDTEYTLFSANFTTGVVTSATLSARATSLLTSRVQAIFAAVPDKAAFEASFAGLVARLVGCSQLQNDDLEIEVDYSAAPVADFNVSGISNPSNLMVTIPFSTSSGVVTGVLFTAPAP